MLCIRGNRLFDGEVVGTSPTVLIDGELIVDVGVQPPADVPVVDLGDVTLMPGLIDVHQHLCFDGVGTLEEQVAGVDDVALRARARVAARRAVLAGITTVRDLGDCRYVTLGLRGDAELPTILCSGPPITRMHGHCWYLGGEAEGVTQLRGAVRDRHRRGCDVIKVMATGGALTPTFPMWETQFTGEEMRAIVDEALAVALPIAAHCHAVAGIEQALDVGVDTIEHCSFFTSSGRSEPEEALMARLASSSGPFVSTTIGRLPDEPMSPMVAANFDTMQRARRRMHELGARIVVGTDAGITRAKPHDVLPYALSELIAFGMSQRDALRAVTSVAAEACGMARRKGMLRRGWDADVLAVAGDPLLDAGALLAPVAVWRVGLRLR